MYILQAVEMHLKKILTPHRGRPGGPVRPIIPGVFLRRYLGRLLTYFDELNAVLQEIDRSFIYAKKKTMKGVIRT